MKLPEIFDGVIGRSRLLAARQAENLKCQQVAESYVQQLPTWTEADDYLSEARAVRDAERRGAFAAAKAIAERIAKRRDHFR